MNIVIIGGGIAGLSAASEIRALDKEARIQIIGEEAPYNRTLLSKKKLYRADAALEQMHSEKWFMEQRIAFSQSRALRLDTATKELYLQNGEKLSYDKCIIATGAEAFRPPIPGSDLPGVFCVRHKQDREKMRAAALCAQNALVVGGGVIGLEIAWELVRAGMQVTIVEMLDYILQRVLDEETAAEYACAMRESGVDILCGNGVNAICGEKRAEKAVLRDGREIPAQIVAIAAGIASNAQLAKDAGITVGRAIEVDAHMRTSACDVYACGDCAQFAGRNAGLWEEAMAQGKVAGANAAGESRVFAYTPYPVILQAFGLPLFICGDMGRDASKNYRMVSIEGKPDMAENAIVNARTATKKTLRGYFAEDKLVGGALLGDLRDIAELEKAVAASMNYADFARRRGR